MPRIALIRSKADLPAAQHAAFDRLAAARGRLSGSSGIVMHSPELAELWNALNNTLDAEHTLGTHAAELAICSVAREWCCDYMWGTHKPLARAAAVNEEALLAIYNGSSLEALPTGDSDVIAFVRQSLRRNRVEDDVFARLLAAHGERWLVELTVLIASYSARAGVLTTFEVEAEQANGDPLTFPLPYSESTAVLPRSTPRIKQITNRDQVAEDGLAAFEAVAEGRGNVRGPYSILMYSPKICHRMLELSSWLNHESAIKPPLRALATITTAREKECSYLWSVHVPRARQEGTSESAIEAVRNRADDFDAAMSPPERDVVIFIRQCLRHHRVEQSVFDRLLGEHGQRWLVDLTCYIGSYGVLCATLNTFEVAPTSGAESF